MPTGAEVWLDGKKIAKPTQVTVPVADPRKPHQLVVKLANYKDWKNTVVFPPGQRRIRALAVLVANYGRLDIGSVPREADVYINGELKGRTPTTIDNLILSEVVNLELRKRGYRPVSKTLRWEKDRAFIKTTIVLKRSR